MEKFQTIIVESFSKFSRPEETEIPSRRGSNKEKETRAYRGGARYFRECQLVFFELRNSAKLINAKELSKNRPTVRPSFIARITNEFRRMISGFIGFTTDAESVPRFLFPVCLSACTLQARVLPFHADDPESTSLPTGSLSTIARNDRATCAHAAGVSDSLVRRSSNATNAMENPSHRCDREKLR